MTKTKTRKTQKTMKKMSGPTPRRKAPVMSNLDQAAAEYAQLLADPCNANLTRTVWPGAGGAFVGRFEYDSIIGNDAVSTNTTILFTPALCGGTSGVLANSVPSATDTSAWNLTLPLGAPGTSFLATTDQFRPVAACAEVYWPGTELNRSGIVSLGVVDTGLINTYSAGNLGSTAIFRQLCQHTERMPVNKATVNWRPGNADQDTLQSVASANFYGHQSILITASGFPVNTGIRVRLVVVMEWWPKAGTGFVSAVPRSVSKTSVQEVLTALDRTGNWLFNT